MGIVKSSFFTVPTNDWYNMNICLFFEELPSNYFIEVVNKRIDVIHQPFITPHFLIGYSVKDININIMFLRTDFISQFYIYFANLF